MGPSTTAIEVNRLGLTLLHPRTDEAGSQSPPTVHIVFIHGLRGHPRFTWQYTAPAQQDVAGVGSAAIGVASAKKRYWFAKLRSKSSSQSTTTEPGLQVEGFSRTCESETIYWPADLLPSAVPRAKIWAYGYNADVIGGLFQANNKNNILRHGNDFMMKVERALKEDDAPVIFVAHSLGGLVVKVAMHRMQSSVDARYQQFFHRIRAVVFCGTPHRGSNAAAWGCLAANLVAVAFMDSNSRLLSDLLVDSEVLDEIQENFLKALYQVSIRIHSFQEGRALAGVKGLHHKVVDDFSSKLGWSQETYEAIDADHREMVRRQGVKDISDVLKDLEQEAVKAARALEIEHPQQTLSDEELKCHQLFRLTSGNNDATYEWYKNRIEDRVEGTCRWFLDHKHFQQWLQHDSGPLLVSADPGCGKSVLAKYLIDHELARSATVCYFFFKDQDQNTVRQALCALLHQLFSHQPSLIRHALPEYAKNGPGLVYATAPLWEILEKAGRDPRTGPVIMVLDALDECAESDFQDLTRMLIHLFQNTSRLAKIKFLLTSRPYEHIISPFHELIDNFPYIRIPGEDNSDTISKEVNLVIKHRARRLATEKRLSSEIEGHLKRRLEEIPNRTYLWVYLVFDYLESQDFKRTKKGIESPITSLPESVNQAYEKILGKSKDDRMVRKALNIVLAASRPLTVVEMNVAVNIDVSSRSMKDLDLEREADFRSRLRSWCGLFISIYHGKVYFLHQTAREFLLADRSSPRTVPPALGWHHSITIRQAHTVLAEVCVTYLNFFNSDLTDNHGEAGTYVDSDAILDYSAKSWGGHFREAGIMHDAAIFPLALRICDRDSKSYSIWFGIYWGPTGLQIPMYFPALMVASYFGHGSVVNVLLTTPGVNADVKDSYSRTPLSWAAGNGHEAVVKLLLATQEVRVDARSYLGRTPLSFAAENGHEAVVKLLLATPEVDVNSKDSDCNIQTPLIYAAKNGHEAVVKLLLEKGADADAKDISWKPLIWAARSGHDAVVKLLLEKGADFDAKDSDYGMTPLMWAAMGGHEAVVKLLLEKGADVDTKDNEHGWTPPIHAARYGHVAVVKLMLEKGADVDGKDTSRWTPLNHAAEAGQEAVVKLLLEKGANADAKDGYGQTPLMWAAARGYEAVVKLLLENGADAKGSNGQTPLSWAAGGGQKVVVKLLLENGADVDPKDNDNRTPLSWAAGNGHDAVVKLLLAMPEVDADVKDNNGRTPLSWAAEGGHEAVIKLLQART